MARVREGDEAAARDLLEHLHPLVLKLVRAHLPRRTSEEDMLQAVFVKVFTRLEQYAGLVPLEHWVSRIAINTCIHQISKERVRPELRYADLSEEEEQVVQSLAVSSEDLEPSQSIASHELVTKLLETLSPSDRMVITLMHLEGRSVEEVRQRTGWSKSVIKVRAFRARRKLRKQLDMLLSKRK
ncbi:MAG: RNA polymerase sigma factor [Verrucomicrobia subdivision 3 bacterium]|nr:RNA polymerase sigma factor [Limisphaerales bacterium]